MKILVYSGALTEKHKEMISEAANKVGADLCFTENANEVPEDKMLEAIFAAHEVNQKVIEFIDQIVAACGKPKSSYTSYAVPEDLSRC